MLSLFRFVPWALALVLALLLFVSLQSGGPLKRGSTDVQASFNTLVERMEAVGKLELVRYQLKDAIEIRKPSGYTLIPDAKVLLIVSGEAAGCIDLTKIGPEHITRYGDSLLTFLMPQPELCFYKIRHEDSKVYNTQFTLISGEARLVEEAYRRAEKQIQQTALTSGLLEQTKLNATLVLKPMLEEWTGRKVMLIFEPAPAEIDSR